MVPWNSRMGISLVMVPVLGLLILLACCTNIYGNVVTEKGFEFYAERPWHGVMPLNSIVNIGYIIVGIYWLLRHPKDAWICTFAWMSVLYGPIQLLRILTQSQGWAVMDQWVTLPIFAWFFLWSCSVDYLKSELFRFLVMFLSVISYNFALISPVGFDISLIVHMFMVISFSVIVFMKYANSALSRVYALALLSMFGFVVLKVVDHDLVKLHPVFSVISGHFLSKICDFMQIHYGNGFIEEVHRQKFQKIK